VFLPKNEKETEISIWVRNKTVMVQKSRGRTGSQETVYDEETHLIFKDSLGLQYITKEMIVSTFENK